MKRKAYVSMTQATPCLSFECSGLYSLLSQDDLPCEFTSNPIFSTLTINSRKLQLIKGWADCSPEELSQVCRTFLLALDFDRLTVEDETESWIDSL